MIFTSMIKISVFAGLENEFSIRSGSISSIISLWPLSLEGHTHRSHDNAWGREVNFPSWASQHISSAIRYGLLLSQVKLAWGYHHQASLGLWFCWYNAKTLKQTCQSAFKASWFYMCSVLFFLWFFFAMKWNNCYLLRRKFKARFLSPLLSALD